MSNSESQKSQRELQADERAVELSLSADRNFYAECQCEQCQEFAQLHESHEQKERKAFEEYVCQAKAARRKV